MRSKLEKMPLPVMSHKHSSPATSAKPMGRRVPVFSLLVCVMGRTLAALVCSSASVVSVNRVQRNFHLELILVKNADVVTLKCFVKWSRFSAVIYDSFLVCAPVRIATFK